MNPRVRGFARGLVQAGVVAAVAFFLVRTLRTHWDELGSLDLRSLDISPIWLVAAVGVILLSYLLLITAWRAVIMGWGESIDIRTGAAIWCLSNMGRYLPGKVWAVAGMAVLATRAGVDPVAATGAALAMQALALGSGATLIALTVPQIPVVAVVTSALLAVGTLAAISSSRLARLLSRITGREFRSVNAAAVGPALVLAVSSWLCYGIALLMLVRGLGYAGIDLKLSVGVFTASYILGFVAVFAPGGIGVREGALLGMLTGALGAGPALVVATSSRLLFTLTELTAAASVLPFAGALRKSEDSEQE